MNEQQMPGKDDELHFRFQQQPVSPELREANWQQIEAGIREAVPVRSMRTRRFAYAAAASILLALGVFWLIRLNNTASPSVYHTAFAQVKKIKLPDGSRVVLNANSTLRLSADWSDQGDRQVWLEGEAYFEVQKKTATRQKFVVHAADVDVEVLGTRFNVNTRRAGAVVSLEEGHIKLVLKQPVLSASVPDAPPTVIDMKPGEVVKLDTTAGMQRTETPNVQYHSGWVRNEFHFNNTSLREIALQIREVYGYAMTAADDQLMQRSVTGDLRAQSLQELLDVLQLTLRLKMTVQEKNILVTRP